MIRICLTGSIATGKTTISRFMQEEGAIVIDTDLITHSIYRHPTPTSEKILALFGSEYLKEQSIDRKKLGERVFKNPQELELLNSIVHPSVRAEVAKFTEHYKKIEEEKGVCILLVYVIPLFFESGADYNVDYVVVASCSQENQFKRLVERNGYNKEDAIRRIKAQIPVEEKAKKADYVIDTNKPPDKIRDDVKSLLKKWDWEPFYEKN